MGKLDTTAAPPIAASRQEDALPEEGGLLSQVMALPPKYREVIFLRYYEGYEVREIAALLGRSPALVSTHLKRGKEKLRHMLGSPTPAPGPDPENPGGFPADG